MSGELASSLAPSSCRRSSIGISLGVSRGLGHPSGLVGQPTVQWIDRPLDSPPGHSLKFRHAHTRRIDHEDPFRHWLVGGAESVGRFHYYDLAARWLDSMAAKELWIDGHGRTLGDQDLRP